MLWKWRRRSAGVTSDGGYVEGEEGFGIRGLDGVVGGSESDGGGVVCHS